MVCAAVMAGYAAADAHAAAAAPKIAFSIPAGPLSASLVEFAVQSNISLGLGALGACAGSSPGLMGRYTVEEGLGRMLKGSGCGFHAVDPSAYVIQPDPGNSASPTDEAAETSTSVELSELVVMVQRPTIPGDLGAWNVTDDLATAVRNLLGGVVGSQSGGCEGCSSSVAVPILVAATVAAPVTTQIAPPVSSPSDGPYPAIEVTEPGTWATILLGLGALGANLRRRRDSRGSRDRAIVDQAAPANWIRT